MVQDIHTSKDLPAAPPPVKKGGFGVSGTTRVRTCFHAAALFSLAMCLSVPADASDRTRASAFGLYDITKAQGSGSNGYAGVRSSSPAIKADPCSPLLDYPSPDSALDRARPSAGQTAAPAVVLGFLMGLRVAPGPVEILDHRPTGSGRATNVAFTDHGERSPALSIAAWRQCRNELALTRLTQK